MSRKLMIMFDLEQTLIDSWNSNTPLVSKIETIRHILNVFIMSNEPKYQMRDIEFGVFSFAVDTPEEGPIALKKAFRAIEYKLNPNFCPCWQDLEKLIQIREGILQKFEIINLYGKGAMFDLYTRQFPEYDFLLFDDALGDEQSNLERINKGEMQTIVKVRV